MRDAGGDEEEVSGPEGNRFVTHGEPAFAFEDDVALVLVVRLLGIRALGGVEAHFKGAAGQGDEVAVVGEPRGQSAGENLWQAVRFMG